MSAHRPTPVPGGQALTAEPWRDAVYDLVVELGGRVAEGPWAFVPSDGGAPIARDVDESVALDAPDGRVAVPVVLRDGTTFGSVLVLDPPASADELSRSEEAAHLIGRLVADLVSAHQSAAGAEALARTDALTGMLNVRGWRERIDAEESRVRRSGAVPIIAVIDLDGLKETNDTRGHLAGDVLLRVTGLTLREAVRTHDVVARIGGDEFGVLAVDYSPPRPEALVDRVRARLEEADVHASIGAAMWDGEEPLGVTLHKADVAMLADKRARRECAPSAAAPGAIASETSRRGR